MELDLRSFDVQTADWGDRLALIDGNLQVPRAEVVALVLKDPRVVSVDPVWVRSGERTRVIHVLDAVEPRVKPEPATAFPGFLGPPDVAGSGRTDRLNGVAVLTAADIPDQADSQGPKEAILDMWGPGGAYQPFSGLTNLVLQFICDERVSIAEAVAAGRLAALRVASYLAGAARTSTPDAVERLARAPRTPDLPGVVYVCLAMREGEVHGTYLYGRPVESLPVLLHPNEVLDGAVVSGDYWIACHRVPTYYYQNDPVVQALYARDGREIAFLGVLVCRCLIPAQAEKHRQAAQAAKMARMLGAAGAVVTMSNGGHAYADQMLVCQHLERGGVRTVISVDEYADRDGSDFPLVTVVPEAVAIVSNGNQEQVVDLPAAERLIGGHAFRAGNTYEAAFTRRPAEPLSVALRQLYCATSQSGFGRLRCVAY
ncbi:MAG TPA: glycine/sarcosine/betaine reductase component B subunit [Gemmatimonadales bacterium]|nr:glycine/sarcosine/betaine reductase component B subunit [Gemmatimonadales bacterium]